MTTQAFSLGKIVATPGALEALGKNDSTGMEYVARHASKDWGDLCEEDKDANESALEDGSRILSSYALEDGTKIWVITDAVIDESGHRQATTILLPEEY